jgi:hypothetical protein
MCEPLVQSDLLTSFKKALQSLLVPLQVIIYLEFLIVRIKSLQLSQKWEVFSRILLICQCYFAPTDAYSPVESAVLSAVPE